MKRQLLTLLFAVPLLVGLPRVVGASCAPLTTSEQFAYATLVLTAQPYSLLEGESGQPTEVVFEPLTVYKGKVEDAVSVLQSATPTSIDADLSADAPYLLFLTPGPEPGTYRTTQCDGTRVLAAGLTGDEQAVLGSGTVVATPDEVVTSAADEAIDALSNGISPDADGGASPEAASPWFKRYGPWFLPTVIILALWSMAWKGLALWRAAQRRSIPWFVALLLVNTAGLLEIVYVIVTRPVRSEATPGPVPPTVA